MKIEVRFLGVKDEVMIDENFSGVTTSDRPHSGNFRVKSIFSVTITSPDTIFVVAEKLDDNKEVATCITSE